VYWRRLFYLCLRGVNQSQTIIQNNLIKNCTNGFYDVADGDSACQCFVIDNIFVNNYRAIVGTYLAEGVGKMLREPMITM